MARIRELISAGDAWSRGIPLHVTGSALVVHPPTRRVLLRWHERQRAWLQVGGHADPGETDPYVVALREAAEETSLRDLVSWPDRAHPQVLQVVVVPVPPGKGEPAHEHADIRFALATAAPDAVTPENAGAPLEWLTVEDALKRTTEDNLRIAIERITALLGV